MSGDQDVPGDLRMAAPSPLHRQRAMKNLTVSGSRPATAAIEDPRVLVMRTFQKKVAPPRPRAHRAVARAGQKRERSAQAG